MNKVRLLKLTSGEEVIFKHIDGGSSEAGTILMQKPITLHVVPQGNEQYGLQLFPYSPSCPEGDHILHTSQIASECKDVPEGLVKAYIQRTTGIEIASAVDSFANMR